MEACEILLKKSLTKQWIAGNCDHLSTKFCHITSYLSLAELPNRKTLKASFGSQNHRNITWNLYFLLYISYAILFMHCFHWASEHITGKLWRFRQYTKIFEFFMHFFQILDLIKYHRLFLPEFQIYTRNLVFWYGSSFKYLWNPLWIIFFWLAHFIDFYRYFESFRFVSTFWSRQSHITMFHIPFCGTEGFSKATFDNLGRQLLKQYDPSENIILIFEENTIFFRIRRKKQHYSLKYLLPRQTFRTIHVIQSVWNHYFTHWFHEG